MTLVSETISATDGTKHLGLVKYPYSTESGIMTIRFDITAIRAALTARAAETAIALLGEPNRPLSSRRELRFRRKGSLAVVIDGAKAGRWYDHEDGIGGDLINLIERAHGITFREAVVYAEQFIG